MKTTQERPGKRHKGTRRRGKKQRRGRTEVVSSLTCTTLSSEEGPVTLNVLNLSDRPLSEDEICLLLKGLHFCPQRHFNLFEPILDITMFICNLTIKKTLFCISLILSSPLLTHLVPLSSPLDLWGALCNQGPGGFGSGYPALRYS